MYNAQDTKSFFWGIVLMLIAGIDAQCIADILFVSRSDGVTI